MTTHTPYDAEIARLLAVAKQAGPGHTADVVSRALDLGLAKQEAYLRALADGQPRIDALVAALEAILGLSGDIYDVGVFNSTPQPVRQGDLRRVQEQARAALKLAGKA